MKQEETGRKYSNENIFSWNNENVFMKFRSLLGVQRVAVVVPWGMTVWGGLWHVGRSRSVDDWSVEM